MQDAVLLLADISGYTRYMLSNREQLSHATLFVQSLMEALISELRPPFAVQEIEGDALFVSALGPTPPSPSLEGASANPGGEPTVALQVQAPTTQAAVPPQERFRDFHTEIVRLCESLPRAFRAKRDELSSLSMCACKGCKGLGDLQIKLIVHTGQVACYETAGFRKVSGVDVILVHRLLKNQVQGNNYVLFSDEAWKALELDGTFPTQTFQEEAEGLGTISVRVYYPEGAPAEGGPEGAQGGEGGVKSAAAVNLPKPPLWDRIRFNFGLARAEIGTIFGLRKVINFGAPKEPPALLKT